MTKGSKGKRQLATAICTAGLLGSLALPTLAMARAQSAQGAQGCQACGDCQTQSISEDDVNLLEVQRAFLEGADYQVS